MISARYVNNSRRGLKNSGKFEVDGFVGELNGELNRT